jgi:hypothetical protein
MHKILVVLVFTMAIAQVVSLEQVAIAQHWSVTEREGNWNLDLMY